MSLHRNTPDALRAAAQPRPASRGPTLFGPWLCGLNRRWIALGAALLSLLLVVQTSTAAVTVIDDFTVRGTPDPWETHIPTIDNTNPALDDLRGLDLSYLLLAQGSSIPPGGPVKWPTTPTWPTGDTSLFTETGLNTSHVIGGTRQSRLTVNTLDVNQRSIAASLDIPPIVPPATDGELAFDTGIGVTATADLAYEALLPPGSPTGLITVAMSAYDKGAAANALTIALTLDDGLITRTLSQVFGTPIALGGPEIPVNFALDDVAFAGINFGANMKLRFSFTGMDNDDFNVSSISIQATDVPSVPEPSGISLAALGIVGFGFFGWRVSRRRKGHSRNEDATVSSARKSACDSQSSEGSTTMRCCKLLAIPALAVALALGFSAPGWALVIDTFDNGQIGAVSPPPPGGLIVGLPNGSTASTTEAIVAGTISGNRKSTVTYVSGSEDNFAFMRLSGPPATRYLNMSSDGGVIAKWNLDYTSIAPPIDLTDGGADTSIDFFFLKADHDFTVKVTLDTSVGVLSQTVAFGALVAPTSLELPFSNFVNGASVITPVTSATPVSGVHVEILGTDSGQYQLDFIETYSVSTPEPSTISLAGFGLATLGWWGWRRRRPAA